MTAVIAPATSDHIAAIAELAREIWYEYYVPLIGRAQVDYMVPRFQSVDAIKRQLSEGYEYYQVLDSAGSLVGYFAVRQDLRTAQDPAGKLFLSKFYLHRSVRGTGTGRLCMEFIEDLARRRRLAVLWLTVNKGNPAVRVYEKLGFRIAEPIVMDIGGGFVMDDYRMEKPLT